MLDLEVATSNARDRMALSYLEVGLDDALHSGRPSAVRYIPTSHTLGELTGLATALCKSRAAQALVLGGDAVTFVPLV